MCRFRVNSRPIRLIFHRFQNVPASCERSLSLDLASVVSVSAAKGVAAEELGGLIDSSVNKEGLSKLLMLQEFSEEFNTSEFGPSQ